MGKADFDEERGRLLREIEADARETAFWTGRERFSERVMAAMAGVPRHEFVREEDRERAYANHPLSIGHGQTISQPFIVALMSDLVMTTSARRVLEVGTGCGYQTAVLATLAEHVYTLEVVSDLARSAGRRLKRLGYDNVTVGQGDGWDGWPEHAPYDAILVTAAPERIPESLLRQLAPGGRMVVPVGRVYESQLLYVCARDRAGRVTRRPCLPVAFVPMIHPPVPPEGKAPPLSL